MKTHLMMAGVALCLAGTAEAHDYTAGALNIAHPHIFETPPTARTAAGYMTITNTGTGDDRLLDAQSTLPNTMLHRTETDANGVSRMIHQMAGVPIPAGEAVTFEPGGLHVMFTGLEAAVQDGQQVPVTLTFEDAGTIEVIFSVQKRNATRPAEDHSGHSN
ncbi:MAG: copper chaperone PCu(A)C [Pseudomonadota bacterium]